MDRGVKDAELIVRAREGDLQAFDRLVARHRARVFAIARQITSDPDTAQDIAQEAFVKAFRSQGTLREPCERFGPWLNTIVRREALRWLRNGHRRPEPVDIGSLRGIPGSIWECRPEAPADLVERVRDALRALPERERHVMILHYLEGRSCEEIAARLHRSVGTVKRILHHSRRKARKESTGMAATGDGPGPRCFDFWIDGTWADHLSRLRSSLAQSVCLAVNKEPKTAAQIGQEIGAHGAYVEETAEGLADVDVLVRPKRRQYLANFIVFDATDWRRLMALVREPAAKVAAELAKGEGRLRAAFERTPLAAGGWAWERVAWPMYAIFVANIGASRNQPPELRLPQPEHPGGYHYWLGAHETAPNLPVIWTTGFNNSGTVRSVGWGHFWTWGLPVPSPRLPRWDDGLAVVAALAEGPLAEQELLDSLGDERDRWRGILAELVQSGLIERSRSRLGLAIPLFTHGDGDVLTPEIDALIGPAVREVAVPAFAEVDQSFDEMGYSRHREHYPQWHRWLVGDVMGEALRFMMEQGVLPRLDESTSPTFATIAWQGDLPLMSWGVD